MPPRKKQAAALPPTPHNGPQQAQPKATHFLDLGDDVYGKIYTCLEGLEDKQALRHSCTACYRSPAVNTHINDGFFEVEEEQSAEDVIEFISGFPVHATMKSVTLVRGEVKSIAQCALASAPLSAAARERCHNVNKVVLQDCKIDDGGAAAALLTLMFPKMRDSLGAASLRLQRCSLHLDFLSILATQSRLRALELVNCEFLGGLDGLMPLLGAFSSLSSLTLHLLCPGNVLDCQHLEHLQSLQELNLKNVCLAGFDTVLQRLSSLCKLHLSNAHLPHSGCHLASNTVHTLLFGTLSPTFPEVSMHNFPALRTMDYLTLDFSVALDGFNDAQKVQLVQRMAAWLAKMPVMCDDGDQENEEEREKKGPFYELRGKPDWSGSLCDAMLRALAPLKRHYKVVQRMRVFGWKFTEVSSLSGLYGFLDNVEHLIFRSCDFGDGALKGGFMEAVQQLPNLELLKASVKNCPRDLLAALAVAHRAGRRFALSLVPTKPSCRVRLREACDEWEILRKGLSSGMQAEDPEVDLYVEG